MRIRLLSLIALIGLAALLTGPVHASSDPSTEGAESFAFGLGLGTLQGNTLYHISSYNAAGGIESELEFPLHTMLVGLEFDYRERDPTGRDVLSLQVSWFMNIDNGSGVMKDSDWLSGQAELDFLGSPAGTPHPGLDIYSESDITLKANIIDARASFTLWSPGRWSIGALAGFLYENLSFEASNVNQVGYGPYAACCTLQASGPVLTYTVSYYVPYLGVRAESKIGGSFRTAVDLGFSPVAMATDKDDHLLRTKVSNGSATGNAYLVTLAALWDLSENDLIQVRGQYLNIKTTGMQTQTWYADELTPTGTIPAGTVIPGIDDKIESHQTTAALLFTHRF
jgi:outer membrane protease